MSVWLLATAIVLFFEGMMLAVAPEKWQQVMRELTQLPAEQLRKLGIALVAGAFLTLLLVYWGRA